MAEDDIYKSKVKYERIVSNLNELTKNPIKYRAIYYCKNPENIVHFERLIIHFEMKDLSYVRRVKLLSFLKKITYLTEKNLKELDRDDINKIVAFCHKTNKTITSKKDFIKDLKCIWRTLFPELDQKGRIDETVTPYPIRHLSKSVDKSKEKLRNDRLTWDEFQKILGFFNHDKRMQAYLMLALESLGRPQEILYTKIKDYEFFDNYAKVWISEHGKEGTGFLQCIDSYPFVIEWFKIHPFNNDPNSLFFINHAGKNQYKQLTNKNINEQLRRACKVLGIDKRITCYSLKRNGVTFRRKRGDSDLQIQHAARWTSTRQLKEYDMSDQEDAFSIELEKRGFTKDETNIQKSTIKTCMFCSYNNGFTAEFCTNCKRPLNREKVEAMVQSHNRFMNNETIQRLDKMELMFQTLVKSSITNQKTHSD